MGVFKLFNEYTFINNKYFISNPPPPQKKTTTKNKNKTKTKTKTKRNKETKKNLQTINSLVCRSFSINIYLNATNTLFPILLPPSQKKPQQKIKKINYRWVHGNFPMSIDLCTTNNLYRCLHPPSPPKKKTQRKPQ